MVDPILNTHILETTWWFIMKLNTLYVEGHKFCWLNLQRKVQIFIGSMTDFHKCWIWAPPVTLHTLSRYSWWPFHHDHPTFLRVIFSSRVMWKDYSLYFLFQLTLRKRKRELQLHWTLLQKTCYSEFGTSSNTDSTCAESQAALIFNIYENLS